jgi:hypothetical protein
MKKFALLIAAAACLFAAPAAVQTAGAETSVRVGVGDSGNHYGWRNRGYRSHSEVVVGRPHCRTVIVRTKKPNGTVIIRKHRRCG